METNRCVHHKLLLVNTLQQTRGGGGVPSTADTIFIYSGGFFLTLSF